MKLLLLPALSLASLQICTDFCLSFAPHPALSSTIPTSPALFSLERRPCCVRPACMPHTTVPADICRAFSYRQYMPVASYDSDLASLELDT
eukprot:6214817-Pleurochrysis_carterae.AAC.2